MNKLNEVAWFLMQVAGIVILTTLAVRLLTGCTMVANAPTDAEFSALISNCTTTWTTRNGVYGRLVTGKGDYASKSIFLPAAGSGDDSYLYFPGSDGGYWSSTPDSDYSYHAWCLYFYSSIFYRNYNYRYDGQSVRPVRSSVK